ncbi:MAG: STAS domain-containing protein [Fibrobacter sp.]|nr:STAS domain-containing protein [Fibrobacter sp.]
MGVQNIAHEEFNEIILSGALNLGSLMTLTPFFSSLFQSSPIKDIVLNLKDVTTIDSSIIRLFLNCFKRLKDIKKTLYILRPPDSILELLSTTNLTKVIPVISDFSEITTSNDNISEYSGCAYPDGDFFRLRCSCGVCGSQEVFGYHFDLTQLNWSWNNEEYLPFCTDKNGNKLDYFGLLPIVCTECFMCGITPSIFNLIDKSNTVVYRSNIDDKTKALHSKSICKRKRLIENITCSSSFIHPRDPVLVRHLYLLADICARTTSVYKSLSDPFLIGYINFILSQFSEPEQKKEYYLSCIEWLLAAFHEKKWKNDLQAAQLFYFLFISNFLCGNEKEAAANYKNFSSMINDLPPQSGNLDFNNPHFWYDRCKTIWNEQIDQKSMELVI